MNLVLYLNLWIFVCSFFGAIYGIKQFFKPRKALYLQMITCAVICLMFASLFNVVFIATQGELNRGFHVGQLGLMGSFMFILSANYGQMDGLVDDRTKAFRATRIKALLVPLILLGLYVLFYYLVQDTQVRITVGVLVLFILPCSYYNFKHIIIYDIELGIIRQLRMYNVLAVVYAFFIMGEMFGLYMDITWLYIAACIGTGAIAAAILPVLKGGAAKWTT